MILSEDQYKISILMQSIATCNHQELTAHCTQHTHISYQHTYAYIQRKQADWLTFKHLVYALTNTSTYINMCCHRILYSCFYLHITSYHIMLHLNNKQHQIKSSTWCIYNSWWVDWLELINSITAFHVIRYSRNSDSHHITSQTCFFICTYKIYISINSFKSIKQRINQAG